MELFGAVSPDSLFVTSSQQQVQLDGLSNQALGNGIDLYMKKEYEKAALEFQKSINLSPSDNMNIIILSYRQIDMYI